MEISPVIAAPIYALGPRGTFSDKAAEVLARTLTPARPRVLLANISAVFERVVRDPMAIGVVPIENSVAGTVATAQDLLLQNDLWIEHEIRIPVAFNLLVRGDQRAVARVFVHPVAERQCAPSLRELVPDAVAIFTDSNTESAQRLLRDEGAPAAAVVPVGYVLPTVDPSIVTLPLRVAAHNTTRFLAIRKGPGPQPPALTNEKASLLLRPHANRPGLLHDILATFKQFDLDLSRIESRPAGGPWEYEFLIDVMLGPGATDRAYAAWVALNRGDWDVRLLGCYSIIRAS